MKFKLLTIFVCTLLFVGCTGKKIETPPIDQRVYQSDYKLKEPEYILFKNLQAELEKNGLELENNSLELEQEDEYAHTADSDYHFLGKDMWANVYIEKEKREKPGEIVRRIELGLNNDSETFIGLTDNEKINSWIADLEDQYTELGETRNETHGGYVRIRDAMAIDGAIINFIGFPGGYKGLEIELGNIDRIPKEFEGVVAELEQKDLFVTDYTNGFRGNQITLANIQHYLNEEINYYREMTNEVHLSNSMAYKIMYDPHNKNHYSTQLYGIIPDYPDDFTPIEDMVGIDVISRVMDMSWDDFEEITSKLNKELEKVKKMQNERFFTKHSAEGQVAGYRYELAAQMYGEFNRFTVLVTKI